VLHGYVQPASYQILAYTTRYADALARAGYLVIHPNLRGYPPSDGGPDRFRVGMAVDTLNLIALVEEQGGHEGLLAEADAESIGVMGHSMGGGIAIRVLTVSPTVNAAVLYGSMSADERLNYERILLWTEGQRGQEELEVPEEDLRRISPVHHLERITAAVSIHHGERDEQVPLEWSEDMAERLRALEKSVEYFTYPGAPHTFRGESDQLFVERMVAFFDQYLKGE
jgi:dipeptidyl aminopeptidase/acylaminoacyl peptidase